MPIIRFRWGMVSRLHWFAASLRPVELLAPLYGSDQEFPQPTGTFTPELPTSRSPFSSSGITTMATERFPRWDFPPLESQLASLHGLFHPLQHAGLSGALRVARHSFAGGGALDVWRNGIDIRWAGGRTGQATNFTRDLSSFAQTRPSPNDKVTCRNH